jgi:integrase
VGSNPTPSARGTFAGVCRRPFPHKKISKLTVDPVTHICSRLPQSSSRVRVIARLARFGGQNTVVNKINRLSARAVSTATKPGRHADGGNLYLRVDRSGAKRWVFYYRLNGRQREAGLGGSNYLGLARAREIAAGMRELLAQGLDPLEARQAGRNANAARMTFGECAEALLAAKASGWRNAKHRGQWAMTLKVYAAPLRPLPVAEVSTQDVLKVLQPLWQAKPETASRLRGRIEAVINAARSAGHIDDRAPNPARWAGHLEMLLPRPARLIRGHHAAMAYQDLPAFTKRLSGNDSMAAMALRFLILTAARTGEVLGAAWQEFDLDGKVWTIPASRMKAGREHRVPLSKPAIEVLARLGEVRLGDFVFSGLKRGRPLSNMALAMALRRMQVDVTPHGFRSSFRDWAGDATAFPREAAEAALAHVIGDKAEQAYRRGDALEKRRALMDAWAGFVEPKQ